MASHNECFKLIGPEMWCGLSTILEWWASRSTIDMAIAIVGKQPAAGGNLYILKTFWCAKSEYRVSISEAVEMAALLNPRSFEEARESLRQCRVLVNEKLDHDRMTHFLQDLCAVYSQKRTCSCQLFRETSECGHVAAVAVHLDDGFLPQKLPRKAKPALTKRKRGRPSGWEKPGDDSDDARPNKHAIFAIPSACLKLWTLWQSICASMMLLIVWKAGVEPTNGVEAWTLDNDAAEKLRQLGGGDRLNSAPWPFETSLLSEQNKMDVLASFFPCILTPSQKTHCQDYHEGNDFLTTVGLREAGDPVALHVHGALVGAAEPKSDGSKRRRPHYEEVECQQLLEYLQAEPKRLSKKCLPVQQWLQNAPLRPGARTLADVNAQMTSALESLQKAKKIKLHRGGNRSDLHSWTVEILSS
eukprot:s342_g6.t1